MFALDFGANADHVQYLIWNPCEMLDRGWIIDLTGVRVGTSDGGLVRKPYISGYAKL
jgi:hypothetical protein